MSRSKILGKNINCQVCNKLTYFTPNRLKKNKTFTCSVKCNGVISSQIQSKKVKTNCKICKKEIFYKKSHYNKIVNHTCSKACVSKLKSITNRGKNNPKYRNLDETSKFFNKRLGQIKSRAAALGIEYNLDLNYILDLFLKQNKKCFYSGVELGINTKNLNNFTNPYSISFDRIDPKKGYTKGNIVLVLNCVNMFKGSQSVEDFYNIINKIAFNNVKVPLKVKKLFEDSKLPYQENQQNAGWDIYCHRIEEFDNYIKIYSGISIEPYSGFYFFLSERSSTHKKGLTLYNNLGIIDYSFRGEIVGIFLKTKDFKELPKVGDRLMQLIPQKSLFLNIEEVTELSETVRGDKGFGSSGT